jgi:hypothetical protein
MLEAYIQVEKDIAVKGYKRALWSKALKECFYYYSWRTFIVWLVVIEVDTIWGGNKLIFWHSIGFIILWISASIYEYTKWSKKMNDYEVPSYTAILDESGVTTKGDVTETRYSWDSY